jgi:hypothetical protein
MGSDLQTCQFAAGPSFLTKYVALNIAVVNADSSFKRT